MSVAENTSFTIHTLGSHFT